MNDPANNTMHRRSIRGLAALDRTLVQLRAEDEMKLVLEAFQSLVDMLPVQQLAELRASLILTRFDNGERIACAGPCEENYVADAAFTRTLPIVFSPLEEPAFSLKLVSLDVAPNQMQLLLAESIFGQYMAVLESKLLQQLLHAADQDRLKAEQEAHRKEALFQASKRLHDQINVPGVLRETLSCLESLYPNAELAMFLSQDYSNVDTRVKPLVFRNITSDLCADAFLEGKLSLGITEGGLTEVAVPMIGKQAVYGVLLLTLEQDAASYESFTDFRLLAETAGSAFENAKLYEQSNVLINELQVINELTKRLNLSLKPKEIFEFTTDELLHVFQADFCSVLQMDTDNECFVVKSSNYASMMGERFAMHYGFCGEVYRTKEALIISDYSFGEERISSKLMEMTRSRSLIATPILVEGNVGGVIMVAHKEPNYFSYDNYKLLQVLATHIGLALMNASLHAEVRRMVITDNLTGLHARHYLNEQIQLKQKQDPSGSLILVDIDYFKRVNDTFGHQIGDKILLQVSKVIKACIRDSDIAARWGGEELAVYLPKCATEQAYRVADRIRESVERETNPGVTVSCGVSAWTSEDEKISPESLFYRADMALYEAKHNGRNRVILG